MDLAVPRDVESRTADLDNVFLYLFTDLAAIANEHLKHRRSAVDACRGSLAARARETWGRLSGGGAFHETQEAQGQRAAFCAHDAGEENALDAARAPPPSPAWASGFTVRLRPKPQGGLIAAVPAGVPPARARR